MTIKIEDYDRALEGFLEDVQGLGDKLLSVLLHGSMACGAVRPGASDIMDAHVVLTKAAFETRESHRAALEGLVETCESLRETGIPFHPFSYLSEDELEYIHAGAFSIFPFEPFTKVVWGKDVLPEIRATQTSRRLGRTYFFEARNAAHFHLSRFVRKQKLTEADLGRMIAVVMTVKKSLSMACLALGMRLSEIDKFEILRQLERAIPGLDTSVVKRIADLRRFQDAIEKGELIGHRGKAMPSVGILEHSEKIRTVAREAQSFLEDLHSGIRARAGRGAPVPSAAPRVNASVSKVSGSAG